MHAQLPFTDEGYSGLVFRSQNELLATTSAGPGSTSALVRIDPTTGALEQVIGVTGMTGVGGFAVNPLDFTLYAMGGGDE